VSFIFLPFDFYELRFACAARGVSVGNKLLSRSAIFLAVFFFSAASLAAFYSELKSESRAEVDFTTVKFIKKPNGSKPGFITYKNYNTVVVSPKPMN
jgi:hypothetical protein